ncbi:MAG: tetratricopeptide repeat protein [Myxococcales bacterium]|nr:tetratricopeptide repeat protein [Myxococcales bacterium]
MKLLSTFSAALVITLAVSACSRNNIEAVNLAIEGDKEKNSNIDAAISKYEQATNLDPTNHRILWKLTLAYWKKERWSDVAATCAKAERLAPKHANYFAYHGMALARQAEKGPTGWADAKGPLEEALKLDANLADAHFELAEVLLHLDDEAGALRSYHQAIETKPDQISFYGPLIDLYVRLGFLDEGEKVAREGLAFAAPGDKALFTVHSLLGDILDKKGKSGEAMEEYVKAKEACGKCTEPGQQIAFFNLGAAYASAQPPRKSEAMQQLQSFVKIVCKGAAAARYADQCSMSQQLATRLGGTLQ